MLSALILSAGARLSLPDVESRAGLERVRERARQGELVCPVCRQRLWLHAGLKRIAYFAHRQLNDCPQARVSEAILTARTLLYQFFQARIASGKLPGSIELEPAAPPACPFPPDLLLHREGLKPVAVVLFDAGLKPEWRADLPAALESAGMIFRPVFLVSRLKRAPGEKDLFALDTTQREFRQASPYGVTRDWQDEAPTLRFLDAAGAQWISLRSLALEEAPQVFRARVRQSAFAELLWSQGQAEWVHPGEAEALKAKSERQAKARQPPAPPAPAPVVVPDRPAPVAEDDEAAEDPPAAAERPDESLPAWLKSGLRCIGCGARTNDWQNAVPAHDACICRACFKRGVRLPP